MTEAELLSEIVRMCDELGLRWHHVYDSRRQPTRQHPGLAGWPDLVIVGRRIIFWELKGAEGVASPEQRQWGIAIGDAGGSWDAWWPRDLRDGTIRDELEGIA